MTSEHDPNQDVPETPTIRDRRRIDPETWELRDPEQVADAWGQPAAAAPRQAAGTEPGDAATAAAGDAEATPDDPVQAELTAARSEAEQHLSDLRRVQAEYVNYKRRVDRDREAVRENARAEVVTELLPILDDVDRARAAGDLTGGFKSVGESLEATAKRLGLEAFGAPGDAFDPTVHEAFMHDYADDVDGPTCREILQKGYRVGERVVRPARVLVVEPSPEPVPEGDVAPTEPAGQGGPEADERDAQ